MGKITVDFSQLYDLSNDAFVPLFDDESRYLILKGGGGSGKSIFAGNKIIYRTVAEQKHRFLIVRKVAKTLRESVFSQLRGNIADWGLEKLFKANKSDLSFKCMNGNEILTAGLDDVEKLKSIYNVTGIWIEEASELLPEDFRQLDIRLRGHTQNYKQMILSFNPISVTHWLKGEFFDKPKPNARVSETTYKNNRFLDQDAINVLEAFAETDPYYYTVYCLGEWGVLGKTIFNAKIVSARIAELRDKKPIKQGSFVFEYVNEKIADETIRWVDDEQGYIKIFEEPQNGYPYVIGGDTAGEGSDNFVGQVINNVSGNQAAVLKHQFDEDLYARQMYCLGKYYNRALLGIETNFSTHPVKELARLGYNHQYNREVPDTYTGKLKPTFGFQTGKITRPLIIANLVQIVREHIELINDLDTLEEMLTFVKNENGKPEAQEGKHDDLIMALAIAYHVRSQQTYTIAIEGNDIDHSKLPPDILEDLRNAKTPEMREYILRKVQGG